MLMLALGIDMIQTQDVLDVAHGRYEGCAFSRDGYEIEINCAENL